MSTLACKLVNGPWLDPYISGTQYSHHYIIIRNRRLPSLPTWESREGSLNVKQLKIHVGGE